MTAKVLKALTVMAAGLAGGWALTEMRAQVPAVPAPPNATATEAVTPAESPLATLDWLVGSWSGTTERGEVEFSCKYSKNDAFMIRSFRILNESQPAMSGMQIIAWDPVQESIRSWTFDSDGGFGEDVWSQADDRYTMRSKYTLADGGRASAIHVMTYLNDGAFQWKSTNREIDGELQPDTAEVVVSRVATGGAGATNPATGGGTNR